LSVLFLTFSGIAGGQNNAPTSQPSEASNPKQYVKIGKGIVPPKVIYDPQPVTPPSCKITHNAIAILWVAIGEQGTVDAVKVERSAGRDLDQKAVDAVKQWKFRPATKDGLPVAAQTHVEVNFNLC
jgi:periplasmic protein TonB